MTNGQDVQINAPTSFYHGRDGYVVKAMQDNCLVMLFGADGMKWFHVSVLRSVGE